LWNFGDGGTSIAQNPAYTYQSHGRYSVSLTVTNASAGTNSTTKTNYITVVPSPAWYSCSWGYRKSIIIDKSKVNGAHTNFPVLISLPSDNDLATSARSDGFDILFTTTDGTKIPHEIEWYRSSNGALVAWVNVSFVNSSYNNTLYMYYGYPSSPDQQNKIGVWDTNYKAVWHFNQTGTGTRYDSTSNANNANPTNYDGNEAVTGKIDGADYLERTNDYLGSANTIGITGNAVRTITFWANLGNTNRNGMVVWGTNVDNSQFGASVRNTHYFLWGYGGVNDWDTVIIPATASWHHHAVINDGTTGRWYVDGVQLGSGFAHTYATTNSIVSIGREVDGATNRICWVPSTKSAS
jgi:PKD repeat protein